LYRQGVAPSRALSRARSLSGALAKNIAIADNLMQNMGKYALLVGLNYYGALQCCVRARAPILPASRP